MQKSFLLSRVLIVPVWGMRVENPSSVAFVFQVFSTNQGKLRPGTFAILAPRLYNSYNHARVPCQHMWQSPGPGPCSKCSKTVEVRCSYSESKSCQREIASDKIQGKQNYRERSNRKSASVSALTASDGLSATQNGCCAAEGFSTMLESNSCLPQSPYYQ